MWLFATTPLNQQPERFWGLALGASFLGWCVLCFGRTLFYLGEQALADGWDQAREEDLIQKIRRGRRSLQVFSASLQTALREPGKEPTAQLDALLGGTLALEVQPARLSLSALRHNRLPGDATEDLESALHRALQQLLADLAPILSRLPDRTPLALLLEIDSGLLEGGWERVWQQAWNESGIRQSPVAFQGSGLDALDRWLDQRFEDRALLLVIALQFAPKQPEGTAEAVVGLLLGNPLTQTTLAPIAFLHRPEQALDSSADAIREAANQALDWARLDPTSIQHAWRIGVDAQHNTAVSQVSTDRVLPMLHTQGLHDLDTLLGCPGKASPWLAIVAATQTLQGGAGPQFIFCATGGVDSKLWSMALTPVPPSSK
ncbi:MULTISPECIES: hypothetical protein [Pseudomonas]|uniref:hypothetical protein n=1 Tax=Pseudomonas TaxID=286 RepID=UPI001E603E50|nr:MULTISPECIES: hypothetical protein [Pseudomonas]MCD4528055.1 hypothetical protein [Pseudomonas sp. C3-2018]